MAVKTGEYRNCKQCGTEIYVPKWRSVDYTRGKFCSKKCSYEGRERKGLFEKGHTDLVPKEKRGHSLGTREKMKVANRKAAKRGELNHNWKGGNRPLRKIDMSRVEYKDWRIAVFQRDNYTCQCCGDSGGVYLHADHIKEYASHTEERHNIDNGITLCFRCHYKKTFPNVDFNETTALRWGVPKKYRKEEPGYCK